VDIHLHMMEISKIIEGCKLGKRKAQKALFKTQYGKLKSVCIRYSKENAEDMVQEAFLQAFQRFNKFEGDSEAQLFAWLKTLAINNFVWEAHKTGRFKEKATDFVEETFKHPITNEELIEVSDEYISKRDLQTNDIMWAIDMLDDDKRAVFNMMSIDGLNATQTAKKLGISYPCCQYRYNKAKRKVKMYITNKELFKGLNKIANVE